MNIFAYQFFQNALLGSLLACVACGIVGTYVVTRRLVFISGGISHSSFGGVGLGMFMGVNPTITAFLFAIVSAMGIHGITRDKSVRDDSAIAVVWIAGMALGVIFCFLSPDYSGELSAYLFGNILTITNGDILLLAAVVAVLTIFTTIFHRPILLTAFDRDYAASRNIPVSFIECAMLVFVAITVVATLRLVGVVLVISMLTVPQMTAMLFTGSYKKIVVASIIIGCTANFTGLMLSYTLNIPSGASIIICSIIFYAAAIIAKKLRNRILSGKILQ